MKRNIEALLAAWKNNPNRLPLLLRGPRQVGKTYALKQFGSSSFDRTHYCNFEENRGLCATFGDNISPQKILQDLSLALQTNIDPARDLLIFDEIQECPRALTSLKYFAEELPGMALCCAGSLLGVHLADVAFPVGKIDTLSLFPMTFDEFLAAYPNPQQYEAYNRITTLTPLTDQQHTILWGAFKTYLVTGGLPAVINTFFSYPDASHETFKKVREVQKNIILAYTADMAKHSGKQNAMHIERLWRNVPLQLGRDQTGSAPKFVFKDVIPGKKGYDRLSGIIDWLHSAGLIIKLPIVNKGLLPFPAFAKENFFKLFVFDVGILGALSQLAPQSILDYRYGTYKGYMAENYIAQAFSAVTDNIACWREGQSEIEFLRDMDGIAIPVEVKSGWVTKSRSLSVFCGKYNPSYACIFSAKNMALDATRRRHYYPLYLASRFPLPHQG